ncbi:AraC family transcriptional regulator [Companilactobacillus jidongensis]|uniref:AraC family transcriptional regulator n=1 Tax=Companilactobacillus jidongensis TaxID=2486006 RepID=UPI000F76753E|nr:GyrI-like domain-containing protein [Companilactobacillus jidongensis]
MNIEHLPSTKIVYFRRIGEYGIENKYLMQSFKKWVKKEGLFQDSSILGIALDDPQNTPVNDCRYDACLITDKTNFNNNVKQRTLVNGSYAVFKLIHTEKVINEFYDNMVQIINKNQLNVDDRPIVERYQPKLVNQGYCEILIPIK